MMIDEAKKVLNRFGSKLSDYAYIQYDNGDELRLYKTPIEDVPILGDFFVNFLKGITPEGNFKAKESYTLDSEFDKYLPNLDICEQLLSNKWEF